MSRKAFDPDAEGLARVLSRLPDNVLVMDREGRIVYLNRAQPGYAPEQFIGMLGSELMPPESMAVFEPALKSVLETREPQEYEVIVTLPDGVEGWFRTRMTWFGEEGGGPLVLLVAKDVTAEKAAAEEAARLKTLLPMCAWCNRIRDKDGGWSSVERYLAGRDGSAVSHGICPRCADEQLGEESGGGQSSGSVA